MSLNFFFGELFAFTKKQVYSCVFAGSFFLLLFLSNHLPLFGLARYDFLFLSAIVLQIILFSTGIETKSEVRTIFAFHLIGLALELFKTHPAIGSWSYPEAAFFKVGGVPLYSGFMYAAVASYMIQAWRYFRLRLTNYPPYFFSIPLAALVYLNFFTHHALPDFRWILAVAIIIVFFKTTVYFTPREREYSMPVVASFILIGFFVWVAENISTFFGAWVYPNQEAGWELVSLAKISSWSLLVIITFIIVAHLKHYSAREIDNKK